MSLTQRAAKGMVWTSLSMLSSTVLNFVIFAVLARLLTPSDFGLMGIIMIVSNFVILMADFGLAAAIIQKQELTAEQLSTFFYLNLLMGLLFMVLVYLSSGLVSSFFRRSELKLLLQIISLSFILTSLGQVFRTVLQKRLDFKSLFKIENTSNLAYGFFSIVMAYKGFGVWSLIYGLLIRQLTNALLSWKFSSYVPNFYFSLKSMRGLFSFGLYVLGQRLANYFIRNLDNIMIGRFLGTTPLGFYTLAYNLMLFPVSKITGVVTQVIFPTFSLVQTDNQKLRFGYLKVTKCISLVTFPVMAVLFSVAPEFIHLVYGDKWLPVVPVIRALCVVGALQSIGTTVGTILYAKGRSDIGFKWTCAVVFIFAFAFWKGLEWGILGVAIMYAIVSIILLPIIQQITNKLIDLRWKDFLSSFSHPLIGTCLIVIWIQLLRSFVFSYWPASDLMIFLIGTLSSIVLYGLYIYQTDRSIFLEALAILKHR